jgi:Copper binding proteins, plastocyanin/azurin family
MRRPIPRLLLALAIFAIASLSLVQLRLCAPERAGGDEDGEGQGRRVLLPPLDQVARTPGQGRVRVQERRPRRARLQDQPEGQPLIQPGKTAKLVVTFKKKGKYPYLCTVPGDAAAGMKGVFTVC